MKRNLTPSCPYGTYQRATSGLHLSEITPKVLVRRMHQRLNKPARKLFKFRDARHSLILGAFEHLREDVAIFKFCR